MRRVQRLGLADNVVETLEKRGFKTCRDVLDKSRLELVEGLGLYLPTVNAIWTAAAAAAAPTPCTALSLRRQERFLPTPLPGLNGVLRGGLPLRTISEIVGPAGCGKTQFCSSVAAEAIAPADAGGQGVSVVYLDTEGAFSVVRLTQILRGRFPMLSDEAVHDALSRLHVFVEPTCATLLQRLEVLEATIIEHGIKLVIVDSIASVVRKEFEAQSAVARAEWLARQAALLKYLASALGVAVLVCNQVTTSASAEDADMVLTVALGNTWAHSVNTRFLVDYVDRDTRRIRIGKSPVAPCVAGQFYISAAGVMEQQAPALGTGEPRDLYTVQDEVALTGKNSFFFDYVPEDQQNRLYRQQRPD